MRRERMLTAILAVLFVLSATVASQKPAQAGDYVFSKVAALGDSAPGGNNYTIDFEPYAINNQGDIGFVADLDIPGGGEGVFLVHNGKISPLARSGGSAPGGGTFYGAPGIGDNGPFSVNASGDAAFSFFLGPLSSPYGIDAGVYRYSHKNGTVTPVIVPGVTPAPGGGEFKGAAGYHFPLNNEGELLFTGIVPSTAGPAGNGLNLGVGIFEQDRDGSISSVVSPGDPAPGGSTFDAAQNPWINNGGDIAFGAHVAGEKCVDIFAGPIYCGESVYLMKAATGRITSIAHQGSPAPGGETYRIAFGPVLNSRGDIVFIGVIDDLSQECATSILNCRRGVFFHSGGTTFPIARPGDPLPGGGKVLTAASYTSTYDLNSRGDVSFTAKLDTTTNGVADTGLYVWSYGSLHLVARTGTVIPRVGTIVTLQAPGFPSPFLGGAMNDRGQILFTATLENGNVVLLVATPKGVS